jgi:hypothetical protein
MTKLQNSKQTVSKNLIRSKVGILNLFRLPARSRFGEGRDFDIRISDLSE